MPRIRLALVALTAAALPTLARADRAPGELIDPAVTLDITPAGFDAFESVLAELIPAEVPIPDVNLSDYDETCIDLLFDVFCWNWYEYELRTSGLNVGVDLTRFDLVPRQGALDLDVEISLTVASAARPGELYARGEVIDLISVTEDCDVWLDPTPIRVGTVLRGGLSQGVVDFQIRPIDVNLDLSGLRIQGCLFESILDLIDGSNDVVGFFGFDIYTLIADAAEPLIEDQINATLPQIESTLEGALSALNVSTEIPLGDDVLGLTLAPSVLAIEPEGLRLGLSGGVDPGARPDPCVSRYVQGGSLATPGAPPPVGGGYDLYFQHLGIYVDDDLVNQLLYAVWYDGLLCFTLDPSAGALPIDLPISLDTTLLNLLTAQATAELFPTAAPLVIATRPVAPPTASFGGDHQIQAVVDQLGLDLYAELDGRLTRAAGLELAAQAGVDLTFDNLQGLLGVDVAFGEDDLTLAVTYNELAPEASEQLEAGLAGIVNTVVGPLLGGLTEGLSFPLPAFNGLGLTEILLTGAGDQGDHLGAYAQIGLVDYTGELAAGGCASGCSGTGCDTSGPPAGAWTLPALWLVARRRRAR
jgi:uncharacterized protein (TIGR03382 family)